MAAALADRPAADPLMAPSQPPGPDLDAREQLPGDDAPPPATALPFVEALPAPDPDDNIGTHDAPLPSSRKRGRPKGSKNKRTLLREAAAVLTAGEAAHPVNGPGSTDTPQQLQKKRRGRPPGSKNKPKGPPTTAEQGGQPAAAAMLLPMMPTAGTEEAPAAAPAAPAAAAAAGKGPVAAAEPAGPVSDEPGKRRRGRPKGSKNKPRQVGPDGLPLPAAEIAKAAKPAKGRAGKAQGGAAAAAEAAAANAAEVHVGDPAAGQAVPPLAHNMLLGEGEKTPLGV